MAQDERVAQAERFSDALATAINDTAASEAILYAMSDIHGCEEAFCEALRLVDLSNSESKLILCGDYLDSRHEHPEFLDSIRLFQKTNPDQIVVLKGNHEVAYLDEADGGASGEDDAAMLSWLRKLPAYYETDTQIFVHAGICEEAEDLWAVGTPEHVFYGKFPQTYGPFEKDIIAGHVGTHAMCGENRVFWDGEAHYFLDGTTEQSGIVPLLAYHKQAGAYSTWMQEDGTWIETPVKRGE